MGYLFGPNCWSFFWDLTPQTFGVIIMSPSEKWPISRNRPKRRQIIRHCCGIHKDWVSMSNQTADVLVIGQNGKVRSWNASAWCVLMWTANQVLGRCEFLWSPWFRWFPWSEILQVICSGSEVVCAFSNYLITTSLGGLTGVKGSIPILIVAVGSRISDRCPLHLEDTWLDSDLPWLAILAGACWLGLLIRIGWAWHQKKAGNFNQMLEMFLDFYGFLFPCVAFADLVIPWKSWNSKHISKDWLYPFFPKQCVHTEGFLR